jgi:hypothetical protein
MDIIEDILRRLVHFPSSLVGHLTQRKALKETSKKPKNKHKKIGKIRAIYLTIYEL